MRAIAISALVAVLLDQASKLAVVHGMRLTVRQYIEVFPPLLNFEYGENRGINFGLLGDGDNRWYLIALAAAICIAVIWWMWRTPQSRWAHISAGLLIGGALGNVIDRVWFGYVQDFLNMSCCGIDNPFVFNVADIFIFAGAIGLAYFGKEPSRAKKRT